MKTKLAQMRKGMYGDGPGSGGYDPYASYYTGCDPYAGFYLWGWAE